MPTKTYPREGADEKPKAVKRVVSRRMVYFPVSGLLGSVPSSGVTCRLRELSLCYLIRSLRRELLLLGRWIENLPQALVAHVLPGHLPFIRLLAHQGSDETNDGPVVGEDTDHVGAPLDLLC